MVSSGRNMYSGVGRVEWMLKLAMSSVMNRAPGVEITMLINCLVRVRSVVVGPGYAILLPPTVSRTRCLYFLRGCMVGTRCP